MFFDNIVFSNCPQKPDCPWANCSSVVGSQCSAASLFNEQMPPWNEPLFGNPGIASLGGLIAFTVTACLSTLCYNLYQAVLLWPMQTRHRKADEKEPGRKFSALMAAALGFQDALLILGYALFAAAYMQRCNLSIYHVKLLSKLFAVIFSSAWASSLSTIYVLIHPWKESYPRSKRVKAMVAVKFLALLFLVLLLVQPLLFLANTETPKFSQPAMAVLGYCYTRKNFVIKSIVESQVGHNTVDLVLGMALGVPPLIYFFATWMKYRGNIGLPKVPTMICILVTSAFSLGYNAFIIKRMWDDWQGAQAYLKEGTSEKEWGFGQIVSVVVLIGPIWSLLEAVTGFCDHMGSVKGDWAISRDPIDEGNESGSIHSGSN